jgi:hypothetical protein
VNWRPREMPRGKLGRVFIPRSVSGPFVADFSDHGRYGTHVRLSNLASSSSLRKFTSSRISSSDHLRAARFFINGRSSATNIAGRLADGAFVTRFLSASKHKCEQAMRFQRKLTRRVAIMTRTIFSLAAAWAALMKRGMTSYFL